MKVFCGIQFDDEREQFAFGSLFREDVRFGNDAEFGAGFFLATDVNLGRRIFADTNKREAGDDPAFFLFSDARG